MKTKTPAPATATAGRPRSADATAAVCKAALELAAEGGVDNATVERIASRAGVAKTTIYRRWPNAAAVVMEAFLTEIGPVIAYREHAGVVDSVRHSVRQLVSVLAGPRGQMLRHLLGAAQSNAELQRAFWDHWIGPRRRLGAEVLQRALERGELRPETDIEVLLDAVFGAVYYRLVIPYAPLTQRYADALVAQVFRGVLLPGPPASASQARRRPVNK